MNIAFHSLALTDFQQDLLVGLGVVVYVVGFLVCQCWRNRRQRQKLLARFTRTAELLGLSPGPLPPEFPPPPKAEFNYATGIHRGRPVHFASFAAVPSLGYYYISCTVGVEVKNLGDFMLILDKAGPPRREAKAPLSLTTGDADFDQAFQVKTSDLARASHILHPALRRKIHDLLSAKSFNAISMGIKNASYSKDKILMGQQWEADAAELVQVKDLLCDLAEAAERVSA